MLIQGLVGLGEGGQWGNGAIAPSSFSVSVTSISDIVVTFCVCAETDQHSNFQLEPCRI